MLSELPPDALLAAFRDAAAGGRGGAAGAVARLATEGGEPRLGWLEPPAWAEVADLLAGYAVPAGGRLLLIGTGGWAFGAQAVREAGGTRLDVLDLLDPDAVRRAVAGPDGPPDLVVAVSESGTTLETRLLADAVRDRYGVAVRWLTGPRLTGQVALFAAPLGAPFLLCASVVAGDDFRAAYDDFVRSAPALARWAARTSAAARELPGRVVLRPPGDAGPGLRRYLTQLARQALGGKSGTWYDIGAEIGGGPAGWVVDLPAGSPAAHPVTVLMRRCYAANALVACVGARLGIRFTTHPAVHRYKRLLADARGAAAEAVAVPAAGIVPAASDWLAATAGLRTGHLVCYDPVLAGRLGAARHGPGWECHPGSTWNHHTYQAVAGHPDIGVAVVLPARDDDALLRAQAGIAVATSRSLGPRGLLLRPVGGER
ncbi:hypothetical protein WEI85_39260 [Actinomycetes bacterium KLBMP 9797]